MPETFWRMDTDEAVLVIEGYKRRLNDYDDLLAHHAMHILRPHMKKNARPDWKKFKLLTHKASAATTLEDAEERRERTERSQERAAAMGAPGLLKNRFGENVTVTRLG